jgi:hypothetical protein
MQQTFPDLPFLKTPEWTVRYTGTGAGFFWSILRQAPAFLRWMEQDQRWMNQSFEQYQWDWVISDNRYGFHHPSAENILITHQLYPTAGKAWFPDRALAFQVRQFTRPFQQIWVPDAADSPTLSGRLSHLDNRKPEDSRVRFIGPLSRFSVPQVQRSEDWLESIGLKPNAFILAVVSGPEPQRSLMESRVLQTHISGSMPLVLLRGQPASAALPDLPAGVLAFNHLDLERFQILGKEAAAIICRAGYSSIMDLVCLGRSALLVPTPGQSEQEYLAGFLEEQGHFVRMDQASFSMPAALRTLELFQGSPPSMDFLQHQPILQQCLRAYAAQRYLPPG